MNWYRVTLQLNSWVASAWQADTIFGHLCWGMRYLYGEDRLVEFLYLYEKGTPPLVLSNGFPGDLLPQPLTAPLIVDRGLPPEEQRLQFRTYKNARKARYLTRKEFEDALNGDLVLSTAGDFEVKRVTLKNQLNRLTSTTGEEGSLYNFEEYYWREVTIYLKLVDSFIDVVERMFHYIVHTGYGKRKSTGYGQVTLKSFEPFAGFTISDTANGFVTLSNFVPAENDPAQGNWRTMVKYGKMGEEYATGEHVFKKPLLMMEAGSAFYDNQRREYYGCLVKGLNPHYPDAVQYAFALPVPMVLPVNPAY